MINIKTNNNVKRNSIGSPQDLDRILNRNPTGSPQELHRVSTINIDQYHDQ